MIINHNVRAMVTQHALYTNNNEMGKSLEKLSTGLRINRAQDDAAGLAMSEQMRGQIRGLGKAKQNAQDGIAALQIAEGGLAEITNIMQRQRELAVQAANDTLTDVQRGYLNDEFEQLSEEITRIKDSTDYNTINMLTEFGADIGVLHIGPNSTATSESNMIKVEYDVEVEVPSGSLASQSAAESTIKDMEDLIKSISGMRATIGAYINRLEYTVNNIANLEFNTQDAESRIRDTDFAYETTQYTRNQILVQSAVSMLSQANSLPQTALALLG